MVDAAHTLNPDDRALWQLPLPAGQQVTVDVGARSQYGYAVELVNLSVTDHVYCNTGDSTELRSRKAQAILPGGTNTETITRLITFVIATDAKLDVVRA